MTKKASRAIPLPSGDCLPLSTLQFWNGSIWSCNKRECPHQIDVFYGAIFVNPGGMKGVKLCLYFLRWAVWSWLAGDWKVRRRVLSFVYSLTSISLDRSVYGSFLKVLNWQCWLPGQELPAEYRGHTSESETLHRYLVKSAMGVWRNRGRETRL